MHKKNHKQWKKVFSIMLNLKTKKDMRTYASLVSLAN